MAFSLAMHLDQNVPLKALNTFGMDVYARYFVEPRNREEILTLMNYRHMVRMPVLYLGGGSNVLLLKNFGGLVVKISSKGIDYRDEGNREILVTAQAGEIWDDFVGYCVGQGWAGLENLSLIPGTVGAAPIQNIGAYGVEAGEYIERVSAVEIKTGKVLFLTRQECRFGYRDSIFKNELRDKVIVLDVTFRLKKFRHSGQLSDQEEGEQEKTGEHGKQGQTLRYDYGDIKQELQAMNVSDPLPSDIRNAVIKIRRRKLPDPAILGNAGSFFKNPVVTATIWESLRNTFPNLPGYPSLGGLAATGMKEMISNGGEVVESVENPHVENKMEPTTGRYKIPAAWLIEQCGWKGFRAGDAGIYPNQPLVLVNYGAASGQELIDLAHQVKRSVYDRFGIDLEFEVNVIG